MPEPWTTSASASIGADGIVTLVEGSSVLHLEPLGEIDPARPQGLFFRDTRFISELRCTLNGSNPEPLAATAPIRSVVCSCSRPPVEGPRRLASRAVPAPLCRPRACARTSNRELRRGSGVLLGRDPGRRRLRRPCSRSRKAGSTNRVSSTSTPRARASRSSYKRHCLRTRHSRRLQRIAAVFTARTWSTRPSCRPPGSGRRASRSRQ